MKFSYDTLRSTRKNFSQALKARDLTLPFQTEHDLWTRIVVSKDFSAAVAMARTNGHIDAIPFDTERIQQALQFRS